MQLSMTMDRDHKAAADETVAPAIADTADTGGDGPAQGMLGSLLGYHLRRAAVVAFQNFGAHLSDDGISPGQLGVLLMVDANPGLNQTGVGRALGIDRSTLVAIIDALEEKGVLKRTPSPSDRRSHALRLTAKGAAFLKRVMPRLTAHEDELASKLSAQERATLIALLEKVVDGAALQE